jgi:uncharacterized membrane protein YfcA
MVALTVALAVLVGIALGLLGGGGSILTVPLLAYVAGMDAKQAIATSLLVVGVTSAVGAISHARAGRVQWRTGLVFGVAGMVGAFAGGLLSRFIPGSVLLIGFAVMMIATAIAMLRGRKDIAASDGAHRTPVVKVIAEGLIVGLVTGLVGAGGGFLVVPALALLGGLPMPIAVGTSLVRVASFSWLGLLPPRLLAASLLVGLATIPGAWIGRGAGGGGEGGSEGTPSAPPPQPLDPDAPASPPSAGASPPGAPGSSGEPLGTTAPPVDEASVSS